MSLFVPFYTLYIIENDGALILAPIRSKAPRYCTSMSENAFAIKRNNVENELWYEHEYMRLSWACEYHECWRISRVCEYHECWRISRVCEYHECWRISECACIM